MYNCKKFKLVKWAILSINYFYNRQATEVILHFLFKQIWASMFLGKASTIKNNFF